MPVRYDSRKFQLSARRRVSLVASKCVRSIIIVSTLLALLGCELQAVKFFFYQLNSFRQIS